jgi:hypothetical protein
VGGDCLNLRPQLLPDHGIDLPNGEARQTTEREEE